MEASTELAETLDLNKPVNERTDATWATLRLVYSYPRFQWLVVTMASLSLLYLSSQEIWATVDGRPYPELLNGTTVIYCAFFLIMVFLVHLNDVRDLVTRCHVMIAVTFASILIDLGLLCLSEFVTLWSIQVWPQEPLSEAKLLLVGAMPGSLGVVTLSSLTGSVLKERASKLKREVHELVKQVRNLDKETESARVELAEFDKRKRAFLRDLGRQKRKNVE